MEKAWVRVKAACLVRAIGLIARPMAKQDDERERRLAEALRANLARRKAQARENAGEADAGPARKPE